MKDWSNLLMTSTAPSAEKPLRMFSVENNPSMPAGFVALVSGKWPNQDIVIFDLLGEQMKIVIAPEVKS